MSRFGLRSNSDGLKLTEEKLSNKKPSKSFRSALRKVFPPKKKRKTAAMTATALLSSLTESNDAKFVQKPTSNESSNNGKSSVAPSIVCSLPLARITGILDKLQTIRIQKQCNEYETLSHLRKENCGDNNADDFENDKQTTDGACHSSACHSNIHESYVKILCLYCDKKFTSHKMQLKHVEKFHTHLKGRRCSGRNLTTVSPETQQLQQRKVKSASGVLNYPGCEFCKKTATTVRTQQTIAVATVAAGDLNGLFLHLTETHADKYFGCKECVVRFQNISKLSKHMQSVHNSATIVDDDSSKSKDNDTDSFSDKATQMVIAGCSVHKPTSSTSSSSASKTRLAKTQRLTNVTVSTTPVSTTTSIISGTDTVIGAEEPILLRLGLTQNRLPNNRKGVRLRRDGPILPDALLKSDQLASTTSSRVRNKAVKNLAFGNEADLVFRVPTRTEIFSCIFDEDFYKDVVANVRTNLLYHLDGKLPLSNIHDTDSTNVTANALSRRHSLSHSQSVLVKSPVMVERCSDDEVIADTDITELHAATNLTATTAFPTLLTADQYGGDAVAAKIRRPHTKHSWKWKWDSVKKFKLVNEGGRIIKKMKHPMLGLRDLSKLDMWTQLTMRQKNEIEQQRMCSYHSAAIVRIYDSREEKQLLNDQLNMILDMRLLPHIILEQNEQAIIKLENEEFGIGACRTAGVEDDCADSLLGRTFTDESFLSLLHLLPHSNRRPDHTQIVLSGEWARPRCYLCMCCGAKFEKLKSLEEHKMFRHTHILSTHYEVVGRELLAGNLLRHLFIPKRALNRYDSESSLASASAFRHFVAYSNGKTECVAQSTAVATTAEDESSDSIQSITRHTYCSSSSSNSQKHSSTDDCDLDTKTLLDINTTTASSSSPPSSSLQSASSAFKITLSSSGSRKAKPVRDKAPVAGSMTSCTKCRRNCHGVLDLYRHMLDCSGDYIWSMVKKRKYRYYCGSKRRRPCNKHNFADLRRGKLKSIKSQPAENDTEESNSSSKMKTSSPRQRPSDAESIKKMLENLPPKRVCKKIFPTLTKTKQKTNNSNLLTKHKAFNVHTQVLRKTRARQLAHASKMLSKKKTRNSFTCKSAAIGTNASASQRKMLKSLRHPSGRRNGIKGILKKTMASKSRAALLVIPKNETAAARPDKQESSTSEAEFAQLAVVELRENDLEKSSGHKCKTELLREAVSVTAALSERVDSGADKVEISITAAETATNTLTANIITLSKSTALPGVSQFEKNGARIRGEEAMKAQLPPSSTAEAACGSNRKRSKKINDCIAMLTGKLEEKLKTEHKNDTTTKAEVWQTPKQQNITRSPTTIEAEQLSQTVTDDKTPKRKTISRRIIKAAKKCDTSAETTSEYNPIVAPSDITAQILIPLPPTQTSFLAPETENALNQPVSPSLPQPTPRVSTPGPALVAAVLPAVTVAAPRLTSLRLPVAMLRVESHSSTESSDHVWASQLYSGAAKPSKFMEHKLNVNPVLSLTAPSAVATAVKDSMVSLPTAPVNVNMVPKMPLYMPTENLKVVAPYQSLPTLPVMSIVDGHCSALSKSLVSMQQQQQPPLGMIHQVSGSERLTFAAVPISLPAAMSYPVNKPTAITMVATKATKAITSTVAAVSASPIVLTSPVPGAARPAPGPLYNAEPLNLTSARRAPNGNKNVSDLASHRIGGIPLRRQTICGFEVHDYTPLDNNEPLDLSKKSHVEEQLSQRPTEMIVAVSPSLVPLVQAMGANEIGVCPPQLQGGIGADTMLTKHFYSNLDLLKIPQIRPNAVYVATSHHDNSTLPTAQLVMPLTSTAAAIPTTASSLPTAPSGMGVFSAAPTGTHIAISGGNLPSKCATKKRNNNNKVAIADVATKSICAGRVIGKDVLLNKNQCNKGKPAPKMDDEVINHIDDAINSVINAVKASLLADNEEAMQRSVAPTTLSVPLDAPSVAMMSMQTTNPALSNILPVSIALPVQMSSLSVAPLIVQQPDQSATLELCNQEASIIHHKQSKRCFNRSKTLDYRPAEIDRLGSAAEHQRTLTVHTPPPTIALTPSSPAIALHPIPPPVLPPVEHPVPSTADQQLTVAKLPERLDRTTQGVQQLRPDMPEDGKIKSPSALLGVECASALRDGAHSAKYDVLEIPSTSTPTITTVLSTPTPTPVLSQDAINLNSTSAEENNSNINNTSSGFYSSAQSENVASSGASVVQKKQRRRRKNELAAIVADQLLESFKIDKVRRDNLKKLENLAYEKSEDLLLTGMLLMSSTKRNVTNERAAGAAVTAIAPTSRNIVDGKRLRTEQTPRNVNTKNKMIENVSREKSKLDATPPPNLVTTMSGKEVAPSVEFEVKRENNKRRPSRRRGKLLDSENMSKLKSSLESFSIGIERQLSELEGVKSEQHVGELPDAKALRVASRFTASPILRPSILSASMERSGTRTPNDATSSANQQTRSGEKGRTAISSRDPRLNKNIHKDEGREPEDVLNSNALTMATRARLRSAVGSGGGQRTQAHSEFDTMGDIEEEDNYLTEIAKNVNEKIMSAENEEEFQLVDDGFDMAEHEPNHHLHDDISCKFYRPPTSMSVRSAPNFNDDRSNFGSICDENTNTEVMDMDLDDDLSVYTSYSQDVGGRGRGRRRRRRRSILLKRRPKKRPGRDLTGEQFECSLCKKVFFTASSLSKHNMTLAHVSKLSEQEYLLSRSKSAPTSPQQPFSPYALPLLINLAPTSIHSGPCEGTIPPQASTTTIPSSQKPSPVTSNAPVVADGVATCQKAKSDFESVPRLTLNPDERLFFECCNILKGAETPALTADGANVGDATYPHHQVYQSSTQEQASPSKVPANLSSQAPESAATLSTVSKTTITVPTHLHTSPLQSFHGTRDTHKNAVSSIHRGIGIALASDRERNLLSPNYCSVVSQLSTVATNTTTSRFKTKAAMKGYENVHVDLTTLQQLDKKTIVKAKSICKLTELADIALGSEKPTASSHFSPITVGEALPERNENTHKRLTTPECITLTVAAKNIQPQHSICPERPKNNVDAQSSTSSKTIMHSSIIKAAMDDHNQLPATTSKIIIPERPFKNIGLEEKATITFQKPKTAQLSLLADDNHSVSTVSYSDRDDFDFGSMSCDEDEANARTSNEKHIRMANSTESSSSSRATPKTFENKSLIMGRIFKNVSSTKPKSIVAIPNVISALPHIQAIVPLAVPLSVDTAAGGLKGKLATVVQKSLPLKADLDQLFDELRADVIPTTKAKRSAPPHSVTNISMLAVDTPIRSNDDKDEACVNRRVNRRRQSQIIVATRVATPTLPSPSVTPTRKGRNESNKNASQHKLQKDVSKLQSELGMSQEEIEQLIDEGQRKSKRRCATNRPKKLVEMWSSDEYEEFLSTKDIIALIEAKEQQEKRKKRKSNNNIAKEVATISVPVAPSCSADTSRRKNMRSFDAKEKLRGREPAPIDIRSSEKDLPVVQIAPAPAPVSNATSERKAAKLANAKIAALDSQKKKTERRKAHTTHVQNSSHTVSVVKNVQSINVTAIAVTAPPNSSDHKLQNNKANSTANCVNSDNISGGAYNSNRVSSRSTMKRNASSNNTNNNNNNNSRDNNNQNVVSPVVTFTKTMAEQTRNAKTNRSDVAMTMVTTAVTTPLSISRLGGAAGRVVRLAATSQSSEDVNNDDYEVINNEPANRHSYNHRQRNRHERRDMDRTREVTMTSHGNSAQTNNPAVEPVLSQSGSRRRVANTIVQRNYPSCRTATVAASPHCSEYQSRKTKRRNQVHNKSSPRQKRLATEKLYYWSSSSEEEEFGRLKGDRNIRATDSGATGSINFEAGIGAGVGSIGGSAVSGSAGGSAGGGGEQFQKHGWIVGDSHKKLVTLLAIAKGNKKVDNCGVKRKVSRKKS